MITIFDVNQSVNNTIQKAIKNIFDYDIPIVAEELKEPIERPSLKIIIENNTNGKLNYFFQQKNMTVYVYFFAKNETRSKFDNIKVQNAIEQTLLDGITINDMWFDIEQVHTDNADGILCYSFDLEIIEEIETNQIDEYMQELKTKPY